MLSTDVAVATAAAVAAVSAKAALFYFSFALHQRGSGQPRDLWLRGRPAERVAVIKKEKLRRCGDTQGRASHTAAPAALHTSLSHAAARSFEPSTTSPTILWALAEMKVRP